MQLKTLTDFWAAMACERVKELRLATFYPINSSNISNSGILIFPLHPTFTSFYHSWRPIAAPKDVGVILLKKSSHCIVTVTSLHFTSSPCRYLLTAFYPFFKKKSLTVEFINPPWKPHSYSILQPLNEVTTWVDFIVEKVAKLQLLIMSSMKSCISRTFI